MVTDTFEHGTCCDSRTQRSLSVSLSLSLYVYIYVYIYVYRYKGPVFWCSLLLGSKYILYGYIDIDPYRTSVLIRIGLSLRPSVSISLSLSLSLSICPSLILCPNTGMLSR